MDKSAVLIDGGYMASLLKFKFAEPGGQPRRIDYSGLARLLAQRSDSELFRAYYYDALPFQSPQPTDQEQLRLRRFESFVASLRSLDRFEVRLGKYKRYLGHEGQPAFEQKGVDVLLAIDALKLALRGKVAKIILVTGDSDFVPVIQAVKDEGAQVHLYYHPESVHRLLLEICDVRTPIDEELLKACGRS